MKPVAHCRCGVYVRHGSFLDVERSPWPIGRLIVRTTELRVQFWGFGKLTRDVGAVQFLNDRVIGVVEITGLIAEPGVAGGITVHTSRDSTFVWGPRVRATLERLDTLPPIVPKRRC